MSMVTYIVYDLNTAMKSLYSLPEKAHKEILYRSFEFGPVIYIKKYTSHDDKPMKTGSLWNNGEQIRLFTPEQLETFIIMNERSLIENWCKEQANVCINTNSPPEQMVNKADYRIIKLTMELIQANERMARVTLNREIKNQVDNKRKSSNGS